MKHIHKFVSSHLICVDISELNPCPRETNFRNGVFLRPFWGGFFDETSDCQHFSGSLLEWKMFTKRAVARNSLTTKEPENRVNKNFTKLLLFGKLRSGTRLDAESPSLGERNWMVPKKDRSLEEVCQWKKSKDGWSLLYYFL